MQEPTENTTDKNSVATWLKSDLTITAPGWAYAVAGLVALVLIGVALD
ncbi:hypothetical protein AADZ90_009925 [Aestuariibius sp. 2305UL40-4]